MECALWSTGGLPAMPKGNRTIYSGNVRARAHILYRSVVQNWISVRLLLLFVSLFSVSLFFLLLLDEFKRAEHFTATVSFSAISFVQMILVLIVCAIFYTCSFLFCCQKVQQSKKKCSAAAFSNGIPCSINYKSWDTQRIGYYDYITCIELVLHLFMFVLSICVSSVATLLCQHWRG